MTSALSWLSFATGFRYRSPPPPPPPFHVIPLPTLTVVSPTVLNSTEPHQAPVPVVRTPALVSSPTRRSRVDESEEARSSPMRKRIVDESMAVRGSPLRRSVVDQSSAAVEEVGTHAWSCFQELLVKTVDLMYRNGNLPHSSGRRLPMSG